MLLAQLGFNVTAVTGKQDRHNWLREIGAAEVVGRESLEESSRPLLSAEYSLPASTPSEAQRWQQC